jgi:hypothetical protein
MSTSDKLAFAAIGISIFTFIFSWYSFSKTDELAKIAFNKNYRPYIVASNFAYINQQDGKYYPNMGVIMIKILNAPALVTSKKLTFYTRENNIDSLLFEHPDYKNELLYPLDNAQNTIGTAENIISHSISEKLSPKKLIRKIRIEYQWISDSDLKYYFESEWIYNVQKQDWDIISQNAN